MPDLHGPNCRCEDAPPRIRLYRGGYFYPLEPSRSEFDIRDIAHALSLMPRFAGHSPRFVSVAQHCVEVSETCAPDDALWGLFHDASEAYLMDMPAPIKHLPIMAGYVELERACLAAICARFGLPRDEPGSVRDADRRNLRVNWNCENPWPPHMAENFYLRRYVELDAER